MRYRAIENGNRQTRDEVEVPRVALGLQGNGYGWDYNVTYLWTESKLTESVEGGFPQLTKVLPLLDSGLVNPFGFSTPDIQQALLDSNFHGETYVNKSSLQSISARWQPRSDAVEWRPARNSAWRRIPPGRV